MTGYRIAGAKLSELPSIGPAQRLTTLAITGTMLRNLDAFSQVSNVRELQITNNPQLEDLDGLDGLSGIGTLEISNNPNLIRLPAFPALNGLDRLRVTDNERLVALSEFPFLASFGVPLTDELTWPEPRPEEVNISRNGALTAVALPPGWRGGSSLIIDDNPSLTRIELTEQLSYDRLSIINNPALTSVEIGVLDAVDVLEVRNTPLLVPSAFEGVRTFEAYMSENAKASQP